MERYFCYNSTINSRFSSAWKEIAKEERSLNNFIGRFFHPFIGIIALAAFVGGLWFAHDGGLQGALKNTIVSIVAVYGGFYIVSYALNENSTTLRYLQESIYLSDVYGVCLGGGLRIVCDNSFSC